MAGTASPTVTLTSTTGLTVTVLLDAASPVLSDGFGGWEVVDRPKRVSITRFKGKPPFKQDIAILFDGWISGESQEAGITTLMNMGLMPGDLQEPPKITLSGMALETGKTWVIDTIDWDTTNVIWDWSTQGIPIRLRQAAVIHLLEYVSEQIITTPAAPVVPPGKTKKIRIKGPKGLTVKQLSQLYYGTPDKWIVIMNANRPFITSPRQVIPAGTLVVIPDIATGFLRTIVVS